MKEQTYKLLDGKATSAQIKQEIAAEVAARVAAGKKAPHLVAILVGHDGGSETYVAAKIKTCAEVGFRSSLIRFEDDVTEERLLSEIERLNNDPEVHGFIVQLPLPKHINEQRIIGRRRLPPHQCGAHEHRPSLLRVSYPSGDH